MLTVDACVTPAGDLVVACHSGPPDWGTGPQGKGKLFKVSYTGRDEPQPVVAWASGPREVRVAFDRPLDPTQLKDLARRSAVEFGPYVRAGDRFEVLKPPYAVVQQQLATTRYDLPVLAAQISADQRTILLSTGPHTDPTWHAVTLFGVRRPDAALDSARSEDGSVPGLRKAINPSQIQSGVEPPHSKTLDVAYDLAGVTADWRADSGDASWSGWLPHLDLSVSRDFTAGSAEHERLWPHLEKPGRLTLHTQLDLDRMLRPAVQPGSSLDYVPPPEEVTIWLRSSRPIEVRAPNVTATLSRDSRSDRFEATLSVTPRDRQWLPLEVLLATGAEPARLEITFTTNEDSRERPLPLRRFRLPWTSARPAADAELAERRTIPELDGGDWSRGRQLYLSESALCSKCHSLRGAGGRIGPDLTNLPHRDYQSVLRDIVEPSAAINPDHVGYTLALKDGRVLSGVLVESAGLNV